MSDFMHLKFKKGPILHGRILGSFFNVKFCEVASKLSQILHGLAPENADKHFAIIFRWISSVTSNLFHLATLYFTFAKWLFLKKLTVNNIWNI